jgi:hypothetical protein
LIVISPRTAAKQVSSPYCYSTCTAGEKAQFGPRYTIIQSYCVVGRCGGKPSVPPTGAPSGVPGGGFRRELGKDRTVLLYRAILHLETIKSSKKGVFVQRRPSLSKLKEQPSFEIADVHSEESEKSI